MMGLILILLLMYTLSDYFLDIFVFLVGIGVLKMIQGSRVKQPPPIPKEYRR